MVTVAAYGAMVATMSAGARIAADRETGWTRQLRISPLPVRTYFRTEVVPRLTDGGDDDRAALYLSSASRPACALHTARA